jgi:hypothetical protein
MGAWGAGIFQNDVSEDLKTDYVNKLKMGKTDEEAFNEILVEYEDMISDPDDEIDFWFALSLIMHKYGRLTDYVKDKALSIIDSGVDNERWEENKTEIKHRAKVIEKLKGNLTGIMPERKKVLIRKEVIAPFEPNQIYYMKLSDNFFKDSEIYNKYLILIIESLVEEQSEIREISDFYPRTYRKLSVQQPKTLNDVDTAEFIPRTKLPNQNPTYCCTYVSSSNIGFTKFKNKFTYLGEYKEYLRPVDAEEKNSFTFELMPVISFNYNIKYDYQTWVVNRR